MAHTSSLDILQMPSCPSFINCLSCFTGTATNLRLLVAWRWYILYSLFLQQKMDLINILSPPWLTGLSHMMGFVLLPIITSIINYWRPAPGSAGDVVASCRPDQVWYLLTAVKRSPPPCWNIPRRLSICKTQFDWRLYHHVTVGYCWREGKVKYSHQVIFRVRSNFFINKSFCPTFCDFFLSLTNFFVRLLDLLPFVFEAFFS